MEAIQQIVRIPENREIMIKIPQYVPKNKMTEMILTVKKKPDSFNQKIRELKEATKDKLFLDDLRDISDDFKSVDLDRWERCDEV
ncbi:hypothetical protein HY792_00720 [Candidatus Desantisbacteria bacterium]|nr:hypothetical protein [Candidatus Desantisbacteria bacterium]